MVSHNETNQIYFKWKMRRQEIVLTIFSSIVGTLLVFGMYLELIHK